MKLGEFRFYRIVIDRLMAEKTTPETRHYHRLEYDFVKASLKILKLVCYVAKSKEQWSKLIFVFLWAAAAGAKRPITEQFADDFDANFRASKTPVKQERGQHWFAVNKVALYSPFSEGSPRVLTSPVKVKRSVCPRAVKVFQCLSSSLARVLWQTK